MNVSNIRLSLSHTRLCPPLNLLISITWSLFSLLAALVRHLSSPSLVHLHLPLSKSQITLSVMHHTVFGIIFLPHSVNLIHHLSPPSYHPSLPVSSIPDLKLTCSTNPSHHRSSPNGLPTGLQPDCLHGLRSLRTILRYVLVLPLSSFSWCVYTVLNWLLVSFWSHVNKIIIHSSSLLHICGRL